jgi:amino acid adenylation domain-containing protein
MKALFGTLANLKIRLAVDDGKLFIDAAPNVVTDEIRAAIRAQKAELISYLTELKSKTRAEQIAPRRADQHNIVPLSFAQQRLWFIDQFEADNAYNLPLIIRLSGNLDALALKQCLDEIVRRHEVLRTTFTMIDDQPVQLVSDAVDIPLVRHDLSTRAPDGREAEALALAQAFVRERFDLSTGPLFKACLVRLGEREHVAVLNMHHIVSDGWSMGVLLNEVVTLYAAYSRQQPSPMSDLAIQYADFALWQRDWVSSKVQDQQLAYWCGQLEGASSILSLPTDHPRPHKQSLQGTTFAMTLSEGLTRALNDLSRQARATLFMTLGAAFNVLLARYSGQDDICIGTPIANRNRAEIEPLIGFFVNTLVLRTRLADVETFDDLLQQVRATTLAAYAHQDIPFELVVDALKPERQLNYNPLFQVMLVLQNAPIGNIELDGLSVQAIEVDEESAKFDLMLTAVERAEQLHLTFTYKVDLFEASTIVRMARHFTRLLESAVQAPNARVGELEMLDDEERQRLLVAFNDTASPYPRGTLAALFETQVRRTPAQVAVVVEDSQLTYAELNARANRVAHYLRSRGVGPDVLVGVCLERSLELVVALLGVLKAGGAYVPLDPAYPMDRLALMLEDCQPHTVLTQIALAASLPDGHNGSVVALDENATAQAIAQQPASDPDSRQQGLQAGHLAYIIYTSGSTGRPKGVMIAHANAVNFVTWGRENFSRAELQRTLFSTSINFDLHVFELYVPLSCGASVRVVRNIVESGAWLRDVTLINTVPSAMAALLEMGEVPPSALAINLAGEPLKRPLAEAIFAALPAVALANLYGPSETTTYSTWVRMDAAQGFAAHIGRPVANTQVYILNEQGQPAPQGVVGEIHIGGDGVCRGYLNRADLTAERFVRDPFAADPAARMYRTGDLGRWLADGDIEYLGRNDHQVKVRGFRIELGEIEVALAGLPQVRDAVVMAREDEALGKRLVAYVVLRDQNAADSAAPVNVEALRAALRAHLPEYMVPAQLVVLPALPLNANGKVDRKALPAPDRDALPGRTYEAPVGEVENALASLWEQILHVEQVSRNDDFFELGGHSLLATQVVSKIRQALRVDLPVRALFEAPTVAALALRVQACAGHDAAPPLVPIERDGPLPLSFAQQRLWFLDQFEPGTPLYNMPAAIRLQGRLDREALQRTLDEIVRRHESLRTRFELHEGVPVQVIAPEMALTIGLADLRDLPLGEREGQARALAQEEARRPFDLANGPLLRACLLCLDEEEHVFVLTMHHIVSDGWSVGVLVREWALLYSAYAQGEASPLAPLAVQYADFAHWQREWLSGEVQARQLDYWRAQLHDAPALLNLPLDRPRPPVQSRRGASLPFTVPAATAAGLAALGKREQATLFMTLMAAFNVLLARYSGQDDICIGTPIANRNRAEIEPLIGCFVNTLVLRSKVDGQASFEQVLRQVRDTALDAYTHQDLPFEQLVDVLKPARQVGTSPLFQVLFVLQNTPEREWAMPGLVMQPLEAEAVTAKFDLTLTVAERDGRLEAAFSYSSELFEASTIARMARHFTRLLESAVQAPHARVGELAMLDDEERQRLLVAFNDTGSPCPQGTLAALFEAQVRRTPAQVAVVVEDRQLTYAELNARANRVAHYLRGRGVGPDVLVGVCLERSLDLIVALLGVLKAGGAYVPLDPAYPMDRLALTLEDAQAALVLTTQALSAQLPSSEVPCVCLDTEEAALAACPEGDPAPVAMPHSLAYVIFTSGSTGRPKGIAIAQHSAVNLLDALVRQIYLQNGAQLSGLRVGMNASFAFDASVKQWLMLMHGATLYVVPSAVRADHEALARALRAWELDALDCTPSQLSLLLGAGDDVWLPRHLLIGGEPIGQELWNKLRSYRDSVFFNVYGPTETTVDALICHIQQAGEVPVLGRPIANVQVYVLDERLNPVPVGVAGELHIAGEGLARAYLRRPGLTAEKFIANPFGAAGSRMYKSGDLVRHTSDGTLEYLGRIDHQVKVRGFRIELGEIESCLLLDPAVRDAVVVAREDEALGKRLVAYVVLRDQDAVDTEALRAALRARLPEYMVPAQLVSLPALPLNANGKVDRKALPAPDRDALPGRTYEAPVGDVENALASLWEQILHVEQVSRNDDFFELGGHSLLATQVVSKIRQALRVDLPVRALFEAPTVAALALRVQACAGHDAAPPLVPVERDGPLPLSFAQQRLWFLDQFEPGTPLYNMPAAIRLRGRLDREALQRTLDEIVRRHESLRTRFELHEGVPVQVIAPELALTIGLADLQDLPLGEREGQARALAQEEARRPFDLANGPLLRACLLCLDEEEHVFVLTMHHIVSDGWSVGVLVREWALLYSAYAQGQASPLAPLAVQYADFAHWQREWLSGEVQARQLDYWRAQLHDAPALLNLPLDRPRPPVQSRRGASLPFTVPAATAAGLAALGKREQATLFMTLMAAFNVLLARYSGQDDICIGTPIANRNRAEIEPLIGCFVNTLVLRSKVDGQASFEQVLRQVRDTALDAYTHQDLPFEQLVDVLKPARQVGTSPLFQVLFVLQNTPEREWAMPGLVMQPLEAEAVTAKFDLTLTVAERDGRLEAAFSYSSELFEASTIARMARHFTRLLESAVQAPHARVGELAMLDDEERQRLVVAFNDTASPYPQGTLAALFEAQVRRTPGQVAVVVEDSQLTYAELNARANRVAHYLRSRGVGRTCWSGSAWSARSSWLWPCWACSRRAVPTCRWTRPIRWIGWP